VKQQHCHWFDGADRRADRLLFAQEWPTRAARHYRMQFGIKYGF
jgi:hypothetical protein